MSEPFSTAHMRGLRYSTAERRGRALIRRLDATGELTADARDQLVRRLITHPVVSEDTQHHTRPGVA